MSFLDNLENNLKALESRESRDPEALEREARRREEERTESLRAEPFAEALRDGPFAGGLLSACRTVGHRKRVLVRPTWIGTTLRLEAGTRRLELTPTAEGVVAVRIEDGVEKGREPVDLASDPMQLAERWL